MLKSLEKSLLLKQEMTRELIFEARENCKTLGVGTQGWCGQLCSCEPQTQVSLVVDLQGPCWPQEMENRCDPFSEQMT